MHRTTQSLETLRWINPVRFGAWAKRFNWREYAAAIDAHIQDIAGRQDNEQLAAARQQTVTQAEQLQALIQTEIDRLTDAGPRRRLWPGAQAQDRTADLAHLAAALKDASAARIHALQVDD
ncbi:MAG: hypothetical protein OXG26_19610 [Caldilineaceae bacterium]|nr:hypothetical protein [Caldilineaceae bacterium]